MEDNTEQGVNAGSEPFSAMVNSHLETVRAFFASMVPGAEAIVPEPASLRQYASVAGRLQTMWLDYAAEQGGKAAAMPLLDQTRWSALIDRCFAALPLAQPQTQQRLVQEGLELWQAVLGQYGIGPEARATTAPSLPRSDNRFADRRWREHPFFALVHQTYLLLGEHLTAMADQAEGLSPERHDQLRFATRSLVEALSPAHFPLTNPVVVDRIAETQGENLVKGMEHLLADLRQGKLTHSNPEAFRLGENIATTPGKVIHEGPMFQLIQYSPTTERLLEVPLVIFPPWINRFYILDLNEKKSFVRWAVDQGLSVFIVSWRSADATMAEVTWDDYVRAQISAIELVRARLSVPAVHTIGYCVAGTTLAATLAVLARRKQADRVASATFFTAQVDFENPGEMKHFIDDQQIAALTHLTPDGYLDGRYMALTFNLLRGTDLIWNYVVNNYLLGEEYPAFDLLHWNGDTTNLPAKWHRAYLEDLYRDNRLVVPDALRVDGTAIDLRLIRTPAYIQAGRDDHIAPAESVWRITRHLSGPWKFTLAGSGHIAGVVNPPAAGRYQYWTNENAAETLEEFVEGATETPGSWWPDWLAWVKQIDSATVTANGKRAPGGSGDPVIEDAPGRYVRTP